jgi:hypothetical protein
VLEDPRLRVRAIEERHLRRTPSLAVEVLHLVHDKRASSSSFAAA